VDEVEAHSTLHQQVGGDRRIDASRDQAGGPTADSDRQTAGARNLVGPGEEPIFVDQNMNGQIGVAEVDRPFGALLNECAEGAFDLRRGHWKTLFRSLAANRETFGSHIFETRPEVGLEVLDRVACKLHRPDPADTEDRCQTTRRFNKENGLLEGDQNPPRRSCHRRHRRHRQIGEGVAHVVGEGALEPTAVAALEADLRRRCEDASHRLHPQRLTLAAASHRYRYRYRDRYRMTLTEGEWC